MAGVPAEAVPGHHPSVLEYTNSPEVARLYDSYHEGNLLFETDSSFVDEVVADGSRVLDLGCGTGRHLARLAARGCRVTGVDLSPHMLSESAARLAREGLDGRLARLDICRLDGLEDGEFDAAVCMFSTLGILKGRRLRRRALAEWRRVLRPGGVLAVHVHNAWRSIGHYFGKRAVIGHLLASLLPGRDFGDRTLASYFGLEGLFIHLFRLGELRALLGRSGFRVERELLLNESRTGPVTGRFRAFRANGFLVAARRV